LFTIAALHSLSMAEQQSDKINGRTTYLERMYD